MFRGLVSVVLILLCLPRAAAFECEQFTLDERYVHAELVIDGTVINEKKVADSPALQQQMKALYGQSNFEFAPIAYETILVHEVFKGEAPRVIKVWRDVSYAFTRNHYSVGQRAVFFFHRDKDSVLLSSPCLATYEGPEASDRYLSAEDLRKHFRRVKLD